MAGNARSRREAIWRRGASTELCNQPRLIQTGTLPAKRIEQKFSAVDQSWIGIVQRRAARVSSCRHPTPPAPNRPARWGGAVPGSFSYVTRAAGPSAAVDRPQTAPAGTGVV